MPLKLNVGLSKKVGLPDYGSLGASCHVKVELDGALLQNDLDGFQERARRAFAACRQAVNDELARHSGVAQDALNVSRSTNNGAARAAPGGRAAGAHGNGNLRAGSALHRASSKQLDYAQQLADQVRGLGAHQIETLTMKMFGKPVADLSSLDASVLIDTLKAIKAGEINVHDALRGAAA